MVDSKFLRRLEIDFSPYTVDSGTEYVGVLAYVLIRMIRPSRIVEFGSGYSTLLMLKALKDNVSVIRRERAKLKTKSRKLGDISELTTEGLDGNERVREWVQSPGPACNADPKYYTSPYKPRLLTFEPSKLDDVYYSRLFRTIRQQRLTRFFIGRSSKEIQWSNLPKSFTQIDLFFNDHRDYRHSFEQVWPILNPRGGMCIFHNVTSNPGWWKDIMWMKRTKKSEMEVIVLEEPHKYNQNGCAIIRKISEYQPSYLSKDPTRILDSLRSLMHK